MRPRRERILVAVVGGFVGLAILYLAVDNLLLTKAGQLDKRARDLSDEIGRKEAQRNLYLARARRLEKLAARTLGSDENLGMERVRDRLVRLVQRSGLPTVGMTLKPLTGPKYKDYYREIGWAVSAKGGLASIALWYI